jgi:hypothetical protein
MIEPFTIQAILHDHPTIEAVLHLSRSGLPLQCFSLREDFAYEEIVSIAGDLFKGATESASMSDKKALRLFIVADHGSMYLRMLVDETILCVLTCDTSSEQKLDAVFESIVSK